MAQLFADAARAYLSAGINNTATTISIASGGTLFPVANGTDWFKAVLQDASGIEIVYVTAHTSASTSFTVTRGQEGTTARSFAAGSVFGLRVTAEDMEAATTPTTWTDITDKPTVIAAGADAAAARAAIGAAAEGETISVIRLPTNTTPAAGATGVNDTTSLVGSTYYSLYNTPMAASQWQVSTSSDFSTTAISTGDVAGTAVTYAMAAGVLTVSTVYYWRVRYKDTEGLYSAWSAPTSFTTGAVFGDFIPTPTATPSAFGDPLEGGFYAGMIWNELVQSATSTVIGTGTKVFTVPSMAGAAIVYLGQTLEVRSRANPANKMVGTVTAANGASLTLNISSVGGSGTLSDWSVMARYRVIVAPKASGENAAIAYKNATSAAPAATGTLTEGRKATLAMVGADSSTVYPAAHWCNNLNIGGKTDWYLPARDELELCYRNLKTTTDPNYAVANRAADATHNYQNQGSYGGTEATHGLNKNSDPAGSAYTTGVPSQTTATAFRTGGAEAYAVDATYLSSTEYNTANIWSESWYTSNSGNQTVDSKATAAYVRAVRRSII